MVKTYTVLNDFEDKVPRGSGLEALRGYKSYEEQLAVFTGIKPSWSIPPWKKGNGANEPYMLFYGEVEIWAGATVRLQMKDRCKFTLTSLKVNLEDQFPHALRNDGNKVITSNIQSKGDFLEVSFVSLAGEPIAAQRYFGVDDRIEKLRCSIRDEFGFSSVKLCSGSEEVQDGSNIASFDNVVAMERKRSMMIKCLEVSGSNSERKRYEEFSPKQKRRLLDQGIEDLMDGADEERQLEQIHGMQTFSGFGGTGGMLTFSEFRDIEWIDLASENAKVKLRSISFQTE
eukprot:TRINITY_DN38939_c0_g1_i2.p1 TRINITY_DN38939_c0_g1~~TRINITY_DN38939_c0_g1_i2.p1  ORF type:complete len:294 (+),score=50.48 TRINITY_DN38939_c0_g1_i2:26-883(+)